MNRSAWAFRFGLRFGSTSTLMPDPRSAALNSPPNFASRSRRTIPGWCPAARAAPMNASVSRRTQAALGASVAGVMWT
jgi:hypothetical protein